ncbi:LysR family transcriptional regulator [Vibrio sp. WXL103]|uniref:LysR family transcriptional regulator n=1 Tax=unclassified Vibrio TaxID=2614977 RepID=UPI003EC92FD1
MVSQNLNLFRALLALCEKKSLKLAGLKLNKSESAVSKQIARLSEELDAQLFERTASGLQPTEYTLKILPIVESAIAALDSLPKPTGNSFCPKSFTGDIKMALPDLLINKKGADIYREISKSLPNARFQLVSWHHDTSQKIAAREIDFGVHVWCELRDSDLHQRVVAHDKLVPFVHSSYANEVEDGNLDDWDFMRLDLPNWTGTRNSYISQMKRQSKEISYKAIVDNFSLLSNLMKENRTAAILPGSFAGDDIYQVQGAEKYEMDIALAVITSLVDRTNPLHRHVFSVLKNKVF